jgi:hypothetical protein
MESVVLKGKILLGGDAGIANQGENGSEKLVHGSGGMELLRAA